MADDRAAEAVVVDLGARGWRPVAAVEQDAVGRLATVRLMPEDSSRQGSVLDVLFASSGIEGEIVAASERLEILPGLVAPIARLGHLVALKLLARDDERRPQDAVNLRTLRRGLDDIERQVAREAVALIRDRGYARDRDLPRDLERLLRLDAH